MVTCWLCSSLEHSYSWCCTSGMSTQSKHTAEGCQSKKTVSLVVCLIPWYSSCATQAIEMLPVSVGSASNFLSCVDRLRLDVVFFTDGRLPTWDCWYPAVCCLHVFPGSSILWATAQFTAHRWWVNLSHCPSGCWHFFKDQQRSRCFACTSLAYPFTYIVLRYRTWIHHFEMFWHIWFFIRSVGRFREGVIIRRRRRRGWCWRWIFISFFVIAWFTSSRVLVRSLASCNWCIVFYNNRSTPSSL